MINVSVKANGDLRYENHVHNVANRIVSISHPWVRPIVQGKVHATAEFGTGKRSYGLNRIMAHLPETSFCVIGIALGGPQAETAEVRGFTAVSIAYFLKTFKENVWKM